MSPIIPTATTVLPAIAPWLDVIAISLFAATGALAAAKREQTIVTACFFALVTGVGGGTVRDWFDAVGLAAYAVFGAAKALDYGVPLVPAALMGVVTACVGGIIRDVLAGEPSIIMRPEIYVTAAALAAGLYVALVTLGTPGTIAGIIAASAGFALRAAAIGWKLALPAYRTPDKQG